MEYNEFISNKICLDHYHGFDIDLKDINPLLKPHQKDIVQWAVKGGRRAIFASFGLGKTFIQLEILRLINKKEGEKQLIIAPLGVRQEFFFDAAKLGITLKFIRFNAELESDGIYITNYESVRDGRLDPNLFMSVSLDEASVLRSFGSKTYQTFLEMFHNKYRFVATATPSPNKNKELLHYGGFLGIMDTGQSLTRFFKRDSTKANNLQINPHKEKEYWLWIHSWAVFIQKPSDFGYDDTGYSLPGLHVHYIKLESEISTSIDRNGQISMFNDSSISLSQASKIKRETLKNRIKKMKDIISQYPNENFLIWHDLESERAAIKKSLPECKEVYGSMELEKREKNIADFSYGNLQYLATKPCLSGSGCNFQRHCHMAIYLGVSFKFNDFIQSIHRIYRFLQDQECHIFLIYDESEMSIIEILKRKWEGHNDMVNKMQEIIKKHGLSKIEMANELKRAADCERIEIIGDRFTIVNNDCVKETQRMQENSVDLIVTSIPFSNHYEYTPSYLDFGHTDNNDHFWGQMDFLTPQLLKILSPGRIYACHVKDRINFGNVHGTGMPTVSPFHAECIHHTRKHGFDYMGMITVVTDVVAENNQTYRLGWTEQCKDGSKMGVGSPEYILLFHKPQTDRSKGYSDKPVVKSKEEYSRSRWQIDAHAFWRSSGNRLMSSEEFKGFDTKFLAGEFRDMTKELIYDYEAHVKIGENLDLKGRLPTMFMALAPGSNDSYVWDDITRMRTLNGNQSQKGLNQHICPLQFDIVDRLIDRYSNVDDIVFDPFAGLMTVPYRAVLKGRKGYGVELNSQYFGDGASYMESTKIKQISLFDMI